MQISKMQREIVAVLINTLVKLNKHWLCKITIIIVIILFNYIQITKYLIKWSK